MSTYDAIRDTEVLSGGYKVYQRNQETTKKTDNLDKDTFLKLLVTQMQNQDPLNPMEDREFIAQMAQFSSLEQMQQLNENMQTTQMGIIDHITAMNNNMVKSQTSINTSLDSLNKVLKLIAEKQGIEIPEEDPDPDDTDTTVPEGDE